MMVKLIDGCVDLIYLLTAVLRFCFKVRFRPKVAVEKSKIIIIGNGPSLKYDKPQIIENKKIAEFYCVNYFACVDLFFDIKPRFYVIADQVFWRTDVNQDFKNDNQHLIDRLLVVDWEMYLICPPKGVESLRFKLQKNSNIQVISVFANNFQFNNKKLAILALKYGVTSPKFNNVLVLALWHGLLMAPKLIEIYGADFSSFKEYYVDQKSNRIYSSFTHFYENTQAQQNAGAKYPGRAEKKLYHRLFQCADSFYQMYLCSELAKIRDVEVKNLTTESYLDCFNR